jgi:hypothetical protein
VSAFVIGTTGTDTNLDWSNPILQAKAGGEGVPGAGQYTGKITGSGWSDALAVTAVTDITGRDDVVLGDIVTLLNKDYTVGGVLQPWSEVRHYAGSSGWVEHESFIDGNLIVHGSITADHLHANAITADKISNGSALVTGGGFHLGGTGGSIGNHVGVGAFSSTSTSSGSFGLIAQSVSGNGIGCGTNSLTASAIVGVGEANSTYTSWKTAGALAHNGSGFHSIYQPNGTPTGSINAADLSTATHAGYFEGDVYVGGTVTTFTGAHNALIDPNTAMEGDIVVDVEVVARSSISDTLTKVGISTTSNQKGAVGIFNTVKDKSKESNFPAALHSTILVESESILPLEVREIKPEFKNVWDDHDLISINSLGEGQINVCGKGGNLEIGDLITTSSIPGKGMKQDDDIIRSYTVAKVRENVTFQNSKDVKLVACIYLCG